MGIVRRIARQCPDDIDDAVARLVIKLRRLAAELHGWIDLDLQLVAAVGGHLLRPWLQQFGMHVGYGRQEVMQLERHGVLRAGTRTAEQRRRRQKRSGTLHEFTTRNGHSHPPWNSR